MPRIAYPNYENLDGRSRLHLEYARDHGTPRPESQAIRAHVPEILDTFTETWKVSFNDGHVENAVKELCRLYISRSIACEYCGTQRSATAIDQGLTEYMLDEVVDFERSSRYSPREKAALRYAQAIAWDAALADDDVWQDLREHFTDQQIVELGYFIGLTLGQQRWIKTLELRHEEYLPGTKAGLRT